MPAAQQVPNSQMMQYIGACSAMQGDAVIPQVAPAPDQCVTPVIAAVAGQTDLNTALYGVPGIKQMVST